jgi:hypothetical protein
MAEIQGSLKQLVRDYMDRRAESDDPPPSRDEIRRQLGWDLLPENKRPDQVDKD